jgi:hypothetical protein
VARTRGRSAGFSTPSRREDSNVEMMERLVGRKGCNGLTPGAGGDGGGWY